MIEIKKYPDGSSYAEGGIYSSNFVFRINSYEDLWHLHQIIDANKALGKKPHIVIPNLIDAQADRRFTGDQSSGLKLVCNFLNSMDAYFTIYHPHNPEVVEALMSNVHILDNEEFITDVLNEVIHKEDEEEKFILMSADAGGFKPLIKTCDQIGWKGETYSAAKSRDPQTGKLTQIIDRQDFGGKDILIVDDLCVYGGTFKGLSKLLKERNCGKLYLAVSHMTVQNLGEDPVTNYFDKVFTTNSKYDKYCYQVNVPAGNMPTDYQPKNLEIIKLFEL